MLRPVLGVAAAGFLGILLWKLASVLLLPLVGIVIGFVLFAIKIAVIIGAVWFVIWLFRRGNKSETKEAPAE